jgi:predicted dehydrogenase
MSRPTPPAPSGRRIGILGSGFIVSECHLVAYRRAGFNPVAIASRDPANAARVAARHAIPVVHSSYEALLDDNSLEVLDIAVPPAQQPDLIRAACERRHVRAILAQKPLALSLDEGAAVVERCAHAGIVLAVNQNMRFDPSVREATRLLRSGALGEPVFATIDMRGVPHWQPWQAEMGSASLRIMSIHHLDCMRHWFGEPDRIYCSTRPDPRTRFPHTDGICTSILEYDSGFRAVIVDDVWTGPAKEGCPADIRIEWRIEGLDGLAIGDIGWCKTDYTSPSSLRHARKGDTTFHRPDLVGSWFPDAFAGTMGELLLALDERREPSLSGRDNLRTLALVEAAVLSAARRVPVAPASLLSPAPVTPSSP